MTLNSRIQALSFLGGIIVELVIFRKGEWDRHGTAVLKTVTTAQVGTLFLLIASGLSTLAAVWQTTLLFSAFFVGLFGAMCTYRFYFHPLTSFPGPPLAKLSGIWVLRESIPDLKFYMKLRKLHDQYGDFVRIRPRELSICHPDAILDVHGPRTRVLKGEFYDQAYPRRSLMMNRDPTHHQTNRKVWDKMFSPKALHEYEPRLREHYSTLLETFDQNCAAGIPLNVEPLFTSLGFDIVSDLMFGKSWNMLSKGEAHPLIKEFSKKKKFIGYGMNLMWMGFVLRSLRETIGRVRRSEKRIKSVEYVGQLNARSKMDRVSPDFYTYLSQAEDFEENGPLDAQLAIVAGSDTVATTMNNICWVLANNPELQKGLHEELDPLWESIQSNIISDTHLAGKPYLHSIINETLRMYPPVPSGLQRLTPPEGAVIAGKYIPGNMIVTTPTYSLQRDARAFVQPNEFTPERWSSRPELILRKDCFVPFSYGPYNCSGRPFAYMQVRMLTAMLVRKYEITFASGKEKECRKYIEEQADCFVLHLHPLPLSLQERKY